MKKFIFTILLMALSLYGSYYFYTQNTQTELIIEFICGMLVGILIMNMWLSVKNHKLNKYKRALEKETISSSENSSKVKILESKIEVLEKALEDALHSAK